MTKIKKPNIVLVCFSLLVISLSFYKYNYSHANKVQASILHKQDQRIKVKNPSHPPYNSIGEILIPTGIKDDSKVGTGTVIGKNTIITAKHVARDLKASKDAKNHSYFYPGVNGKKVELGKFRLKDVKNIPNHDLVLINLGKQNDKKNGKSIGEIVAPVKIKVWTKSDTQLKIVGYPVEKEDQMWKATGHYSNYGINSKYLFHNIDTTAGESGAPILNKGNEIIGIHLNGRNNKGLNSGEKIDTAVLDFINKNIK